MWITFKICTFLIFNNFLFCSSYFLYVVNYFQNLYLCDFKQHYSFFSSYNIGCELLSKFYLCDFKQQMYDSIKDSRGCELLSKFVSLWLQTTYIWILLLRWWLWITFKICIFVTPNNQKERDFFLTFVMNYFQNLYLCDFQ